MTKLNAKQLGAIAYFVGFPESKVPTAVAIALAESSGNTDAVNHNSNGSTDHGLWQINDKAHPDLMSNIDDPIANGKAALAVWKAAGDSFKPWSTYTSGAFALYMDPIHVADAKAGANDDLTVIQGFPNDSTITAHTATPLDNVLSAVQKPLNAVGSALQVLTSPATWLRVALIVGGALIVLVGIVFMIESDKSVSEATQSAAKLAVLA